MPAIAACLLVVAFAFPSLTQELPPDTAPPHECGVDLRLVGQMEDVLSNALMRGLDFEEGRVRGYLEGTRSSCADGPELLTRSAAEFGVDRAKLAAAVERFRHVNCGLAEPSAGVSRDATALPLSRFAQDVTLHVVLHELGHALIREFDLPVLGNEETMADAFATHYLTTHLPERALDVLRARVASLEFEASEVPRAEWDVTGEHDNDARRARQIAALAVAADAAKYRPVADVVGLSDDDVRRAADYGAEIHRSWRRILEPLWMPEGQASTEAALEIDGDGRTLADLRSGQLPAEIEASLRRFDWHSQVEVRFVEGDGRAGWSRRERAVTVHSAYLQRFVTQGEALARSR
jgi:hypothetical protein